ncbi:MAG: hypothetical protein AAGM22_21830 [Acidobacteriota bacterium]
MFRYSPWTAEIRPTDLGHCAMNDKRIAAVRKAALLRFPLPSKGIHGIQHWERVHANAVFLAKHSGADLTVVRLFAYLHDCCRESDGSDFEHGLRAAHFAETLRDTVLELDDRQFEKLAYACEFHERGRVTDDPTVGTCWDADRLDLGRVGIRPNPKLLSTRRAKRSAVIDWAWARSRGKKAHLKR